MQLRSRTDWLHALRTSVLLWILQHRRTGLGRQRPIGRMPIGPSIACALKTLVIAQNATAQAWANTPCIIMESSWKDRP